MDKGTQPTNADLDARIVELSTMLGGKLDNLTSEVSAINRKYAELEQSVQFNSDKLSHIESREIPKLQSSIESEVQKLEKKITMMEIYNRKANLLFYGVDEGRDENTTETLKNKVFTTLGLGKEEAAKIAIINAHRLPRRGDTSSADNRGPNPIIAKFCFMQDRDRILSLYETGERNRHRNPANREAATGGATPPKITVRTDLPPALKAQRGKLANEAYKMRKEKGVSTKIIVREASVVLLWKEKGSGSWKKFDS